MIINRRKLKVQRQRFATNLVKYSLALIVISLFVISFARFEAWFNRDYNAHVCAVNGYQPDCVTKLNK